MEVYNPKVKDPQEFKCKQSKAAHDVVTARINKTKQLQKAALYVFPSGTKVTLEDLVDKPSKSGLVEPDMSVDVFKSGKSGRLEKCKDKVAQETLQKFPTTTWTMKWQVAVMDMGLDTSFIENNNSHVNAIAASLGRMTFDPGDLGEDEYEDAE